MESGIFADRVKKSYGEQAMKIVAPMDKLPEWLTKGAMCENWKQAVMPILRKKYGANIEIEARLGTIKSKDHGTRMNFNTRTPIVFNTLPGAYSFESSVRESDFRLIAAKFDNCEKLTKQDKISIYSSFRVIDEGKEYPKKEKKVKINTIAIYFPRKKYDLRISISSETPELFKKDYRGKPILVRHRKRDSFIFDHYNIDFTEVKKNDSTSVDDYEIECEVLYLDNFCPDTLCDIVENLNLDRNDDRLRKRSLEEQE